MDEAKPAQQSISIGLRLQNSFRGVSTFAGAAAICHGDAAALPVIGVKHVRGRGAVVHLHQITGRIMLIGGKYTSFPCSGDEPTSSGISIARPFISVIPLGHEPAALTVVVPGGHCRACLSGGDHGFAAALGIVAVLYGIGL